MQSKIRSDDRVEYSLIIRMLKINGEYGTILKANKKQLYFKVIRTPYKTLINKIYDIVFEAKDEIDFNNLDLIRKAIWFYKEGYTTAPKKTKLTFQEKMIKMKIKLSFLKCKIKQNNIFSYFLINGRK